MPRQFTAILLLEAHWDLNIDAIADALRTLFPAVGSVDSIPGQTLDVDAGVLMVEGASVVVRSVQKPYPAEAFNPAMRPLRAKGAEDAATSHRMHLVISSGGALPGLEGAEAYAALVHFVATAVVSIAPASAVFWKTGWTLTRAETFSTSANMLLQGRMPVGTWISFASVVPTGMRPEDGMGMVTYGMQAFIDREIELAPRPSDARSAFEMVGGVCRRVLNKGQGLADGLKLSSDGDSPQLTVRERNFWLRRDQPAFVLVAEDAVVDSETLRTREQTV